MANELFREQRTPQETLRVLIQQLNYTFRNLESNNMISVTGHHVNHQSGGSDEINVAGLNGVLAQAQIPITENVQDIVANYVVEGNGIKLTYNDPANTLTIAFDTSDDVQFASVTPSNLTANRIVVSDANKKLVSDILSNWITGTLNQITVTNDGDGTVTLSLPQDINTTSSPTFNKATLSSTTALRILATDGDKATVSVSDLSSWIAGTANRITVTNDSDGTITLNLPQDFHTTANVQFGTAKVGNVTGGNYSEFEADGTLKFNGDATVWKDENFSATLTAVGASAPTLTNWDTSNIQIPVFGTAQTKELNLLKEYDHAGKVGASITFHAHVFPTTNASGTIKFYLEYYIKNDGNAAVTGTLNGEVSTNSTAWEELRLDVGTVTTALLSQGTQIGARLYRLNTDSGTYNANVAVSTWGYHYELDTAGSRQITTK